MPYVISMFGNLKLPIYIRQGDSQSMGTGAAQTSFLPLPGGGFYDNYRGGKSPQGTRPLTKSGLFWGTPAELRAELMAWRAMLGVRERLTLEFDDGTMLWQWARLQNVDTPRPSDAKSQWNPVTFTWITAAQNWRSFVHAEGIWSWGDSSWLFGDGSAAFGVGQVEFTLGDADETVTVTHNGTIDAPNVLLRLEMTGAWGDVTIINQTTGQYIKIDRSPDFGIATIDQTPWLEIDASARRIQAARLVETLIQPATHEFNPNRIHVSPAGAHGLTTGDSVRLRGAGAYSGDYAGVVTEGAYSFYVPVAGDFEGYGTQYGGTLQGMYDIYDLAAISDKKRWFVLAPGDNIIRVIWSQFPTSATLKVSFDEHYG